VYVIAGHQPSYCRSQAVLACWPGPVHFSLLGRAAFRWPWPDWGAAMATLHPGLLA